MKIAVYAALALFVGGPVLLLLAGQAGLFRGSTPNDLGVHQGKLKPPPPSTNSVSSQAQLYSGAGAQYARIDPIRFRGDPADALTRIGAYALLVPGGRIMASAPDYLYVQFESRWLKFIDDCEFWAPPLGDVIHVRCAARLGRKDFGVNRRRVEYIRMLVNSAP